MHIHIVAVECCMKASAEGHADLSSERRFFDETVFALDAHPAQKQARGGPFDCDLWLKECILRTRVCE